MSSTCASPPKYSSAVGTQGRGGGRCLNHSHKYTHYICTNTHYTLTLQTHLQQAVLKVRPVKMSDINSTQRTTPLRGPNPPPSPNVRIDPKPSLCHYHLCVTNINLGRHEEDKWQIWPEMLYVILSTARRKARILLESVQTLLCQQSNVI